MLSMLSASEWKWQKRPNCLGIGTAEDTEDSNMDKEYHEREGSFGEPVWVWQKN